MIIREVEDRAAFQAERFNGVLLNQTQRSKTMLVCLEPGQAIPVHSPGVDLTLTLVQGRATLVAGEEELADAGPGTVMLAEAGEARGLCAEERTLALVTVSPPPTEADHEEVFAHLQRGTWR
ncbi:MAG: hypothetical protein ACOC9P_01185 [bacterium]